jgi:hypothetical protein
VKQERRLGTYSAAIAVSYANTELVIIVINIGTHCARTYAQLICVKINTYLLEFVSTGAFACLRLVRAKGPGVLTTLCNVKFVERIVIICSCWFQVFK